MQVNTKTQHFRLPDSIELVKYLHTFSKLQMYLDSTELIQ